MKSTTDQTVALKVNRGQVWVSHHRGDVDRPDEVAFWTLGHFRLKDVGLRVDGRDSGAVFLEGDLLHGPVLPAQTNTAPAGVTAERWNAPSDPWRKPNIGRVEQERRS